MLLYWPSCAQIAPTSSVPFSKRRTARFGVSSSPKPALRCAVAWCQGTPDGAAGEGASQRGCLLLIEEVKVHGGESRLSLSRSLCKANTFWVFAFTWNGPWWKWRCLSLVEDGRRIPACLWKSVSDRVWVSRYTWVLSSGETASNLCFCGLPKELESFWSPL